MDSGSSPVHRSREYHKDEKRNPIKQRTLELGRILSGRVAKAMGGSEGQVRLPSTGCCVLSYHPLLICSSGSCSGVTYRVPNYGVLRTIP